MTPAAIDDPRRLALIASNARARWVFVALALVVPTLFGGLYHRQSLRLRALADHGQRATATLVDRRGGGSYYRYAFAGHAYDWNVRAADAPFAPGDTFPISVLPEDPSLSRPVWPYTAAQLAAERDDTFAISFLAGLFAFFALGALLSHRAMRRAQAGLSTALVGPVSPERFGRVVAALLIAVALSTNRYHDVQSVYRALWGDTIAGLPTVAVVTFVELLLWSPLLWVLPALVGLVWSRRGAYAPVTAGSIVDAVVTPPPAQRRARTLVVAGGVYFAALFGGWIAYASWRGV